MKKTLSLLLLLLLTLSIQAQRGRKQVVRPKANASATVDTKLFKSMLPATAKIMFIDSVVVDKNNFIKHVPLNEESGSLHVTNPNMGFARQLSAYQNELGDRRIYADGDSAKTQLYTQTMLGDKWSRGAVISDFGSDEYVMQNYPFLAADGVTLYFSAEGSESMGGRDIFMSSFDSDKASWYKPQNVGLPFNSTANDYLLAIDDLDTLGWLVTDRRQPEGKVCIYTFVPTETRLNFDDDDLDDNELLPYARIINIRETWKFGNRNAAIVRRDNMLKRIAEKAQNGSAMHFVVSDNVVVNSPSQFKSDESRKLYSQIMEIRQMHDKTVNKLDDSRKAYHNGNKQLSKSILDLEKQEEQQVVDIHNLEKKIRQIEQNVPSRR